MALWLIALVVWLVLFGINALGWVAISSVLLGVVALITAALILIEAYHPLTVFRRNQ